MKINRSISFLFKIYLLVLSIFSVFRMILFLTELGRINFETTELLTIAQSFIMGVRFDIVMSGYILILPAFVFLMLDLFLQRSKLAENIFFYWIYVLFTISFVIAAADIPYFNQFYDRFSIGAFEWIENFDFVISMILQEPKYFLFVIPFLILNVLFFILLKRIFKQKRDPIRINIFSNASVSLLFLFLIFVGIRGRIESKSPIRVGTAYFSNNAFLNKLGLNPVFTLLDSYRNANKKENKLVNFMDEDLAVRNVQSYLNIHKTEYSSPIARKVQSDSILLPKPNIVLVLMESMGAAKMKHHGNKEDLTPFLDSLSTNSIYFKNTYSAGKHTFNGIFSTLFSFPALYRQHTMKVIKEYDGMSSTLLKNGYSTTYFTTHDSQFDNVEGFLRANDFQNIISESDYPKSEVKTTLGVPDDYMFRFSIPILNNLAKAEEPFFVTFMTASDHGPYYLPEYFTPKTKDIKTQIVEYADWALQNFVSMASKEVWFDNTIFVFIADHGSPIDATYDIALNYFHTPLFIYAPKIFSDNRVHDKIGSQIDVYPTIMGLLKQEYINNTLGVDLINEDRKYAIINDDDKIGILDSTYFCIMKGDGSELELYKYRDKDRTNYFEENKSKALDMAEYAKSNMQVYQNMILSGETTINSLK